mmetsp:Transcript_25344/g.63938  ORF Transcript_25344/g.63938 Transcript_25344/m.63938 type:complete len:697 (-) Transcript_25344:1023-3113(-)
MMETSVWIPLRRPSSSCWSWLSAQRFRSADTQQLTISLWTSWVLSTTDSSTSSALFSDAVFWFISQLASALASAAPACSAAPGTPSRIMLRSASMPPHLLSTSLFLALLMHALRIAPAACSWAPCVPVASSCTRPGMATRTSSLTDGSHAHAFQMAPAASSCPTSVPDRTCCTRMGMPPICTTCAHASSLSTIRFHRAVVAFSCAWGSPTLSRLRAIWMPPASRNSVLFSALSSMAFATAAVAASLTLGVPCRITCISACIPPCSLSCRRPSSSDALALSKGAFLPSTSLSLITLASALAAFSCVVVLELPSSLMSASIPPAMTAAALFSTLDPHAAAIACAAFPWSSCVLFLSSPTMTATPCPGELASVVWLPGLLAHASKTAPAPCACVASSLASCIMSISMSMPPTARKMGGGLSPPVSGGFHCLPEAAGAPMGASSIASKCEGMLVSVPLGTAVLLAGICDVLTRGVLPRCTMGPAGGTKGAAGTGAGGVCAGIWYWRGPFCFSRKGYMPWLWCMLSRTCTHVSVVGRSFGFWAQASCMRLMKPTGAMRTCWFDSFGRPGGGNWVSLTFIVTCCMICTMSIPAHGISPVSSSHMTMPTEYMSTLMLWGRLCMISGAMYWGVPVMVLVPGSTVSVPMHFESPKSATLTLWSGPTSMLSVLKSPWIIPAACTALSPYMESSMYLMRTGHGSRSW